MTIGDLPQRGPPEAADGFPRLRRNGSRIDRVDSRALRAEREACPAAAYTDRVGFSSPACAALLVPLSKSVVMPAPMAVKEERMRLSWTSPTDIFSIFAHARTFGASLVRNE
jgi:hypothetical protein